MNITISGTTVAGIIGAIAGSVATATMLWAWVGRPMREVLGWVKEFRSDWNGVPDRPGVPGRDGMMVRMSKVEGQLTTNGGSSLRDEIKRTEAAVSATQTAVADIQAQMASATVISLPAPVQPAAGALQTGSQAA